MTRVLGKLKNGIVPGSSSIRPEMDTNFEELAWDLEKSVWEEKCVQQQWVDAIHIPSPKKGNLHSCDNWQGIILLDVMGKVVAWVNQGRLQKLHW